MTSDDEHQSAPADGPVAPVERYMVRALRWSGGWELHIWEVTARKLGVTQCSHIGDAQEMIADYICTVTGAEPGTLDGERIQVHVE